MKIVVLGGGISTERHVSLVTASSVCKGLRQLGHKAVFVDMFLGLEDYDGKPEDLFDCEDGRLHIIVDLDQVARFDRCLECIGHNTRNTVADMADLVVKESSVMR